MSCWFRCLAALVFFVHAEAHFSASVAQEKPASTVPRVLRVIYFVPTDRQPEPAYEERLDLLMTEIQRFFREGMQQNGYGPKSFELDRDPSGKLMIHKVNATGPMSSYGRNDAFKVRDEVKTSLKDQLDLDHETIIIFEVLLKWDGPKAIELGPYVGGGNAQQGTAWVFDDAKVDPRLLTSKEPGGYYGGPCSLGEFNTHYIGGIAHELGHALGLPHECEAPGEDKARGRSLMGAGNHTYGQELRGQGKGTFLSSAAALPLSVHPLFTGKQNWKALTCKITEIEAQIKPKSVLLTGKLKGDPNVVGIVAYNDPQDVSGDYDAVGSMSTVDAEGQFRLTIDVMKPGTYELRLRAVAEGGDTKYFNFNYEVTKNGRPQLDSLLDAPILAKAVEAFRAKDAPALKTLTTDLKKSRPAAANLQRKLAHYQQLLSPVEPTPLSAVSASKKTVALADVKLDSAKIGWGPAFRNQTLIEGDASGLLEVGGKFFESGFFAHAPAEHSIRLDKKWKLLTTSFGLQDHHDGSVVFVIKGDGKELFRSDKIKDHTVHEQRVPLTGVDLLELIVEEADEGNRNDWAVWLDPKISR